MKKKSIIPDSKKDLTYKKWATYFQQSIKNALTQINKYDPQLTSEEIEIISLHSYNALELTTEHPQNLITKYKVQNDAIDNSKINVPENNKNILFVTSIFPGLGHGGGLRIFDIMHELTLKGYQISLFCPEPPPDEKSTVKHLKKFIHKMEIVKLANFHHIYFTNWLKKQNEQYSSTYYVWPYHAQMIFLKNKFLKNQIFEFIEVTTRRTWMDLVSYFKSAQFSSIPEKLLEFWMSYNFEQIAVQNCNHLVCVTQKDAEFVESVFKTKVSKVIPMGISQFAVLNEIDKVKQNKPLPMSVGFLGNYQHYPNKDAISWYLEKVHPLVLKKVPNYKFLVIGKGDLSDLKKKFKDQTKSIDWVGPVNNVVEWMQKLEICTAPIVSGAGIRVKVTQYAALEKPIVSTELGVCGMPFKNKTDIFIEDQPDKFAEAIINLLQDQNLRTKISQNSKKIVKENFYWGKFINDLEQIL